jgi:hypothetical protein
VGSLRSSASGACLAAPAQIGTTNVWARWLQDGDTALLLFNVGHEPAAVSCDLQCLAQLAGKGPWAARDVWQRQGAFIILANATYTSPELPADGGSLLLRLTPLQ